MRQYRGCDLLLYSEVKEDSISQYVTTQPQSLGALAGIELPALRSVETLWKDGQPYDAISRQGNGEIVITTEGLTEDFIAYLLGTGDVPDAGYVIDNGTYKKRYFALGCRMLYTDTTNKYVWYQKGLFTIEKRTFETMQGTVNSGTVLVYTPVYTIHLFSEKPCRSIMLETATSTRVLNSKVWSNLVWTPDNLADTPAPVIYADSDHLQPNSIITVDGGDGLQVEVES